MTRHHPARGFTLIELLVVVAIIMVLLAIALPSYQGYVLRAQRADARVALMRVAQFMERAATANGLYPHHAHVPAGVLAVEGGRYFVTLVSTTGVDFTATATRMPGTSQASDRCGDFRIDQAGRRTILNAWGGMTEEDCWRK